MIIDLILDRKDGDPYDPKSFYNECVEYSAIFRCNGVGIADDITSAMDFGTEKDVRKALCDYIIKNEYNPEITKYINSKKWLVEE